MKSPRTLPILLLLFLPALAGAQEEVRTKQDSKPHRFSGPTAVRSTTVLLISVPRWAGRLPSDRSGQGPPTQSMSV